MDATLLFFFLICGDILFVLGGCSLESAADSLPSCRDYAPVAVHLLFAGRLKKRLLFSIHGEPEGTAENSFRGE